MRQLTKNYIDNIFSKSWRPFLIIACVIIFVYGQTLLYDIVYSDDHVLVLDHYSFNRDLGNIPQAFKEDIFKTGTNLGSYYRPILRMSFMLDAQFGQKNVIFFSHLSNIIFHIFVICLLLKFLIKTRVKKEWAFLFSMLLAVHPLITQTVSWIGGRNDSLLAIFVLLSLIYLVDFLETTKTAKYLWHLLFFTCALFTKETAALLPIVYITYVLMQKGLKNVVLNIKKYILLFLPWVFIGLVWFKIRTIALGNTVGGANFKILDSIYENFGALVPTIGKVFLPLNLSTFPIMVDMKMVYGIVSIIILGIWFVVAKKKNYLMITFGFIWFFAFMLLSLVVPVDTVPEFSEHRIYLPMFGFVFVLMGLGRVEALDKFINWLIPDPDKRRNMMFLLITITFLIFAVMIMNRNPYYKDGLSFWRSAVATSPSRAFNYNNLGAMYLLRDDSIEAEKYFNKALALNPLEPLANYNLGLIYEKNGEFDKALNFYLMETILNPNYANSYFSLGVLYYKKGQNNEAQAYWEKVLEIDPHHYGALNNLEILKSMNK